MNAFLLGTSKRSVHITRAQLVEASRKPAARVLAFDVFQQASISRD